MDLGAGCCSDINSHRQLFDGVVTQNLQECKNKCLSFGKQCKFIIHGWKGSNWCTISSPDISCKGRDGGPSDCGKGGGNNGVHTYEYIQGRA